MTTDTRSATSSRLITYALLASGMALFGTATPVSAIVGEVFPAILGSALRMVTAAGVLVPLYALTRRRQGAPLLPDLGRRDWLLVLAISVVGTFGFTLLLLLGLRIVPGRSGLYSLCGRHLTADLSPLAIASLASVLAGLLFAPIAVVQASGFSWTAPGVGDWLAVGFWGAGTLGLGSVLWFRGMRRTSGTTASAFMAVMPVSALIGSYVLLGERFIWIPAVGMAAVLARIAAVTRSDAQVH